VNLHLQLFIRTIGVLMLVLFASQASAQDPRQIDLVSVVEVEVVEKDDQGNEVVKRVPAKKVIPGTEVIYTTTFKYNSDQPGTDIVITNPIPQFTVYKIGSASGDNTVIQYSVNNGQSFHSTAQLKVMDEEGNARAAQASDYTDIRWTYLGQLEKGDEGSVEFRVVLN
jgi:hypothetical protein